MLTEEERQAIVTYRLEKAENALKQVEANIANEFWDLIANRFTMLHIMQLQPC